MFPSVLTARCAHSRRLRSARRVNVMIVLLGFERCKILQACFICGQRL